MGGRIGEVFGGNEISDCTIADGIILDISIAVTAQRPVPILVLLELRVLSIS